MSDSSHHHHAHHCHHGHSSDGRLTKLWWVLFLTGLYMIAEVVGGFMVHSLALLADAGHMLVDVGAIALALFAAWFAEHPSSPQKTFGYYRIEILAALFNALFLGAIAILIIVEAYQRLGQPVAVQGQGMFWIAMGGLIINLLSAWILHSSQDSNLNMRGVYLHVLGDLLGSVGTIAASVLIWTKGLTQSDPIFSIVIALLVLLSSWKLLIEAVNILLEGSPAHISVAQVKQEILAQCGVVSLHDLHVWSITSGKDALSVHVVVEAAFFKESTLTCIQHALKDKFGLSHLTIQLEPPDFEEDELHF